jgi:hypothetical protein
MPRIFETRLDCRIREPLKNWIHDQARELWGEKLGLLLAIPRYAVSVVTGLNESLKMLVHCSEGVVLKPLNGEVAQALDC